MITPEQAVLPRHDENLKPVSQVPQGSTILNGIPATAIVASHAGHAKISSQENVSKCLRRLLF